MVTKKTVKAAVVEMMDVVDKDDKVIGQASRDEAIEKKLRTRLVHVILVNAEGEMLVQWRKADKKVSPRTFIASAAGGCEAGENYADAAARELKEELGVKTKLTRVGAFQINKGLPSNCELFMGKWDGEVSGWEEEADALDWWSRDICEFMQARFPYLLSKSFQLSLKMFLKETEE